MSYLLEGISEFTDLKSEMSDLRSQAEGVSRQLRGWADSLQNTGIKGRRYLHEKTRRRERAIRERDEFLKELDRIRKRGVGEQASS